jgi:hypothetical protein
LRDEEAVGIIREKIDERTGAVFNGKPIRCGFSIFANQRWD